MKNGLFDFDIILFIFISSSNELSYLSNTLTMAEFIKIIRTKLEIEPERALFFLANGKHTVSSNDSLGQIYELHKDKEDEFLYMTYSEEMVYGKK